MDLEWGNVRAQVWRNHDGFAMTQVKSIGAVKVSQISHMARLKPQGSGRVMLCFLRPVQGFLIGVNIIVAFGEQVNSTEGYTNEAKNHDFGAVLLLAHGAGAPSDSPFMEALAARLSEKGVTVVRFEFPYMQKRREDGRKRPPDRAEKLLAYFSEVIERQRSELLQGQSLFIGGKSMGGRMASLLAADPSMEGRFQGVLCFGYPFHPPGKLDRWRTDHFGQLWCPVTIQQGTRDAFGKPDEVAVQMLPDAVSVNWLEGGNHDFLPPKKSPFSQDQLIEQAADNAVMFIKSLV